MILKISTVARSATTKIVIHGFSVMISEPVLQKFGAAILITRLTRMEIFVMVSLFAVRP